MKPNENKIDELFQQGLESHRMVPRRDIWAAIEAAQKQKNKKRFIFFLLLLVAAGLSAVGYLHSVKQDEIIATTESTIKKKALEQTNPGENGNPALEKEAGISASGTDLTADPKKQKEAIQLKPQGLQAGKQQTITEDVKKDAAPVGKKADLTTATLVKKNPANKTNTKRSQLTNAGSPKEKESSVRAAAEIKEQAEQVIGKDETVSSSSSGKAGETKDQAEMKQKEQPPIQSNPSSDTSVKAAGEVVATDNVPILLPLKDSIPAIAKNDNTISKPDSAKSRFFISVLFGPALNDRTLSARNPDSEKLVSERDAAETGINSMQYMVSAGYNLTPHLDINLGLAYTKSGMNSSFVNSENITDTRYNIKGEKLYKKNPEDLLTDVIQIIDTIRDTRTIINKLDSEQRYAQLKMPVSISYRFNRGRSTFSAGLGTALTYMLDVSGDVFGSDSLHSKGISLADLPLRTLNVEAVALAGYELRFAKKLSFMLQPAFNWSFAGMFSKSYPLLQRNYSIALLTGIKYHF